MLGITCQENNLTRLEFLPDDTATHSAKEPATQLIIKELMHYFNHPQHIFTFKPKLTGTAFQNKVWQALQAIPCGQPITYGALAKQLQTGPRAIGQACRTNPIPIIVPCHRVIATNHLGGYAGNVQGKFRNIKEWLLTHEK
jgi:methylated-DNA-[protein]-cysteine S-methyltransferase